MSVITTSIIIVGHLSLWYNSRQTFLLSAWKILSFMLKVSLLFMGYVTIIELLSWRIFILKNCRHPYRRSFSILYLPSRCCTCPFASLSCGKVFMVLLCRLNKRSACNFCSLDDYEAFQICFWALSKMVLHITHNKPSDLSCNTQYQNDTFPDTSKIPFHFMTRFIYVKVFIRMFYW